MGFRIMFGAAVLLIADMAYGQTTVDLTARITPPSTAGVVIRWFTDAGHTNPVADPTQVVSTSTPTNYWAFFYDTAGDCYSSGAKVTLMDAACPVTTVNLKALPGGDAPKLVWHSAPVPVTGDTEVPNPTAAGPGTYWAFFFDAAQDCYSPASSPVIVQGECSLPVSLLYFDAVAEGTGALLKWATASEENSKGFEVQRSADAKHWRNLGFVEAKSVNGVSVRELKYSFTDAAPPSRQNYYRLKMIDLDGTFAYSNIAVVRNNESIAYTFPNPTSGLIRLTQAGLVNAGRIELINMEGKVVYKANGITAEGINVKGLVAKGVYLLKVYQSDGIQSSYKVMLTD